MSARMTQWRGCGDSTCPCALRGRFIVCAEFEPGSGNGNENENFCARCGWSKAAHPPDVRLSSDDSRPNARKAES